MVRPGCRDCGGGGCRLRRWGGPCSWARVRPASAASGANPSTDTDAARALAEQGAKGPCCRLRASLDEGGRAAPAPRDSTIRFQKSGAVRFSGCSARLRCWSSTCSIPPARLVARTLTRSWRSAGQLGSLDLADGYEADPEAGSARRRITDRATERCAWSGRSSARDVTCPRTSPLYWSFQRQHPNLVVRGVIADPLHAVAGQQADAGDRRGSVSPCSSSELCFSACWWEPPRAPASHALPWHQLETVAIVAGLLGSFVGGLLLSLLAGDGLALRPSGIMTAPPPVRSW